MKRIAVIVALIGLSMFATPATSATSASASAAACSGDYWTTQRDGAVTAHVSATPHNFVTWDFRTTLPAPRAHVVETTPTSGGEVNYFTNVAPSQLLSVKVLTTLGLTWCPLARR